MKIEINIDATYTQPKIVVYTHEVTPAVTALIEKISAVSPSAIIGYRDNEAVLLDLIDIVRIYALDQRVYAETSGEIYLLRGRLYELETLCKDSPLVRISNSEIANFKQVKSLDLSGTGTIMLSFKNGKQSFVSRRYMTKIRSYLGL